jgi:hypothetical protein
VREYRQPRGKADARIRRHDALTATDVRARRTLDRLKDRRPGDDRCHGSQTLVRVGSTPHLEKWVTVTHTLSVSVRVTRFLSATCKTPSCGPALLPKGRRVTRRRGWLNRAAHFRCLTSPRVVPMARGHGRSRTGTPCGRQRLAWPSGRRRESTQRLLQGTNYRDDFKGRLTSSW